METSEPKPKQKTVKAVKVVYKVKTSVNEKVNVVENKNASSPEIREKTFVPKPKQKFVKAVYNVKCSVRDKTDSVKSDDTVLREKGKFFKYVRPNQVWVRRRSNRFDFVGH